MHIENFEMVFIKNGQDWKYCIRCWCHWRRKRHIKMSIYGDFRCSQKVQASLYDWL